jgi:tripartite-type tricarboxylate transporter receptor subunit TctC
MIRRTLLCLACGCAAALLALPALAQEAWPTRPVKLISPFPAGGTSDVIEAALRKVMTSPEIRQRLESVGFVVPPPGAAAYTKFVQSELDLWTRVIKSAGIKPE